MAPRENRRKSDRYQTVDRAYALLKPHGSRLGEVRDVSRGGISFDYVDILGYTENGLKPGKLTLDIVVMSESLYLSKLPCRIVHESTLEPDAPYSSQGLITRTRRCGVKFENLEEEHTRCLDRFIQNCCVMQDSGKAP